MIEWLEKFGFAYCDLPTMMWNAAVMLRLVAVKIERDAKPIPWLFYLLTIVFSVVYLFNYYVLMFYFVFIGCRETGDVLGAIMVLSISMNSLTGINKLVYIYIYRNKVQSLVAEYLAFNRVPLFPGTTAVMAAHMRSVRKRLLLFWAVMVGNAFMFNLQPLTAPSNVYDKHVLYGMNYVLGITNYPFVVANIVASSFFICYITASMGGFLIVTTSYSEGRLLVLSQEMRDLWSDAHQHYSENFEGDSHDQSAATELNNYVKYRLQIIVKNHAVNIDLIKKLEFLFRNSIAVEFVLITAGLTINLLGGLEDTYVILPFAVIQVSMDCYLGQKLMDSSKGFDDAIYDSKWENFNVTNRKTVLLMLTMSQKTLQLSAGGVATLSFECLMAMYKAVYSAYTALRSTMQ